MKVAIVWDDLGKTKLVVKVVHWPLELERLRDDLTFMYWTMLGGKCGFDCYAAPYAAVEPHLRKTQ
jgi:hypothetical protein